MSFEWFAIFRSIRITIMSKLTNSEECPSKLIITECGFLVDLYLARHTYFQFMLAPRISNNLPIVYSFIKRSIPINSPKHVIFLFQVYTSTILTYFHFLGYNTRVPLKSSDDYTYNLSLQLQVFHLSLCFNECFVFRFLLLLFFF